MTMREAANELKLKLRDAHVIGSRVIIEDESGRLFQWTGERFAMLVIADVRPREVARMRRNLARVRQ